MKILILSPVHGEQKLIDKKNTLGIPYYQAQASWARALLELGHTVEIFIYSSSIFPALRVAINRKFPVFAGRIRRRVEKYYFLNIENWIRSVKLRRKIDELKPDVIFISGGITSILPFALSAYRKNKTFLLSGVNPLTSSTDLEKKLLERGLIDVVVENDQGYAKSWKKIGANKVIVLPISSAEPKLHKKILLSKQGEKKYHSDVCFVGSITEYRIKKLLALKEFNFKFWGDIKPGVNIPEDLRKYYQGEAYGKKMLDVLRGAKIILNFQPQDMTHGGNMRTFEIPAVGGFMLVDRIDETWFRKIKPITFTDTKDAVKKVKYYLKYEKKRLQLAKDLQEYVLKYHTYKNHFKTLLETQTI